MKQDIFKSNNCRTDYLEIRDGYWHKSPVLGRYCGSGKISELIKSTGSRMLVTLTTTHRQEGHRGFAAHYEGMLRLKSFSLMSPFNCKQLSIENSFSNPHTDFLSLLFQNSFLFCFENADSRTYN